MPVKTNTIEESKVETVVEVQNKGYIVSSLNHPVELRYGSSTFILPPRGQMFFEDLGLVSGLPNGTYLRRVA